MKFILAFITASCLATASLANGWEESGVEGMNDEIEQTNFIVENFCSATLINKEEKLLLTNYHCLDRNVRKETRDVTTKEGEVVKKTFEVRKPIAVSQKQYAGHELVAQASFIGDIVFYDRDVDLGLVKLKVTSLPHTHEATIFTGDQLHRGEIVFAVGNPRGLDLTVTKGVISNLNRKLRVGGKEFPYFQMDARIAGGSSGGSLYNANGELIGVPAAASQDGSINLAIPYTAIQKLLDDYKDSLKEEEK